MRDSFNIKSLNDYDTFWADFVCKVTNLNRDFVLISFQQNGQIAPKINQNFAYIHTELRNSYVSDYKERLYKYDNDSDSIVYNQDTMRLLSVAISFYGKDSDILSTLFSQSLGLPNWLLHLNQNKIAVLPNSHSIVKIHERINERWWDRCDLKFDFYDISEIKQNVDYIKDIDLEIYHDFEKEE